MDPLKKMTVSPFSPYDMLVRLVLTALAVEMFVTPCVAQVQPGSTGGSIGKTDKSISGEGQSAAPEPRSKPSVRVRDADKKSSTDGDDRGSPKVYSNPKINGLRVIWCAGESFPGSCGRPAADAWCRSKGLSRSTSFAWDYHSPAILSRTKCDGVCGALTKVVCE